MIYDDFREYIDQNVNLCMLKTLNYQAGQKPDYSDIHIQQLYLLRYVFSYAFEYKSILEHLDLMQLTTFLRRMHGILEMHLLGPIITI